MARERQHTDATARAAAAIERLTSAGGRRVTVALDADTLAALARLREAGGHRSDTEAIAAAIRAADPGPT